MAAGLGFKTFTTGEVLTAADTNGYLMQGILVFASAAARDAAITSPQEGQFAYLKDTNVTTYYTGSAWANVDTTGMTNPMTTTGDTIYSSSGSTPARLGIGSTGQVLTVAAGIPSWATPASGAGLTLISSTTIGTTVSTVAVSSCFSSTYDNYKIIVSGGIASSNPNLDLVLGSTTSGYYYFLIRSNAYSSVSQSTASNTTSFPFVGSGGPNSLQANFDLLGPNLAKRTEFTGTSHTTNSSSLGFGVVGGFQNSDTQFTGFTLGTGGDGTMTGGTIKVYGYSN